MMAEVSMKSIQSNMPIEKRSEVISRGVVVLFPEPMNPKAIEVLKANQLNLTKQQSEELKETDIDSDTLVLAMTESEKNHIKEHFKANPNLFALREFAGEAGDIAMPHGGTIQEYGVLYEHIDLLVKLVAEKLVAL